MPAAAPAASGGALHHPRRRSRTPRTSLLRRPPEDYLLGPWRRSASSPCGSSCTPARSQPVGKDDRRTARRRADHLNGQLLPRATAPVAKAGSATLHRRRGVRTFPHRGPAALRLQRQAAYAGAGIGVYGDPDREGGVHATGARGQMHGVSARRSTAGSPTRRSWPSSATSASRCPARMRPATGSRSTSAGCSPDAPAYDGAEGRDVQIRGHPEELEGCFGVGIVPGR